MVFGREVEELRLAQFKNWQAQGKLPVDAEEMLSKGNLDEQLITEIVAEYDAFCFHVNINPEGLVSPRV